MKKITLYLFSILLSVAVVSCSHTKKLARQHHKDLEDTYETLKREMPEATVTLEGERVKVVLPASVLFTINSADIVKDYYPILAKMARVLNKYSETSVLITGYTDNTGTDALNNELSLKRADNAKRILIDDKVKVDRLFTWGKGSSMPVADNSTEAGRAQNRRVEYVIMYDYKGENQ